MHAIVRLCAAFAVASTLGAGAASAATLHVPSQYGSIGSALGAAGFGDTIEVAAGTYNEGLIRLRSGVTLRGAGADVTIIDSWGRGDTLYLLSVTDVTIEGFTITNRSYHAQPNVSHQGLYIHNSSRLVMRDNVFRDTSAQCLYTSLVDDILIESNTFEGCSTGRHSGAISLGAATGAVVRDNVIVDSFANGVDFNDGSATITGNTIVDSARSGLRVAQRATAVVDGNLILGGERGVEVLSGPVVQLTDNVIADSATYGVEIHGGDVVAAHNTVVGNGVGVICGGSCALTLRNSVIAGNAGGGLVCYERVRSVTDHNIYWDNGVDVDVCSLGRADLQANPLLAAPGAGDYTLSPGSPAIDAGDDAYASADGLDHTGGPRALDGDGDGRATVDMGAFEAPAAPAGGGCVDCAPASEAGSGHAAAGSAVQGGVPAAQPAQDRAADGAAFQRTDQP